MKKRLFLALPARIDDYKTIQDDFADIIGGRWVPSENLHLTLNFYGDQFEQDELLQRLSLMEVEITPSMISGLGYFEKRKILYAKIDNPALTALYKKLNTLFDLPGKNAFVPHVTLMRVKELVDKEKFHERLDIYKEREIGSLGSSLELIQSELYPDGAKYTLLKRF